MTRELGAAKAPPQMEWDSKAKNLSFFIQTDTFYAPPTTLGNKQQNILTNTFLPGHSLRVKI